MYQTNAYLSSSRNERILRERLTKHASKRLQQRGISEEQLVLILAFGVKKHDGDGGVRYFMTQSVVEKVCSVLGRTPQIDRLAGMYAVVSASEEAVITVGHRH
jgi:hypothetical protein